MKTHTTKATIQKPTISEIQFWNEKLRESGFTDIDSYDRHGEPTLQIPNQTHNPLLHQDNTLFMDACEKYLRVGKFDSGAQHNVFRDFVKGHKPREIAQMHSMTEKQAYKIILKYKKATALRYGITENDYSAD